MLALDSPTRPGSGAESDETRVVSAVEPVRVLLEGFGWFARYQDAWHLPGRGVRPPPDRIMATSFSSAGSGFGIAVGSKVGI